MKLFSIFFSQDFKLPKMINALAIALISNQDSSLLMSHSPSTSCCNVLNKYISKLLANRLKKIMHDIISPFQSAFIPTNWR